uniref:Uncharacterized protein n=1 Tax=Myoviridae sp. ct2Qy24 TaxID=2827656 RepID=A0A8S5SSF5_9CAUD|nr:MAG TPA: hypothetical protein [Myoviridae sp. ct2Qy24]
MMKSGLKPTSTVAPFGFPLLPRNLKPPIATLELLKGITGSAPPILYPQLPSAS